MSNSLNPLEQFSKKFKIDNVLIIQKVECIQTASELDSSGANFYGFLAKAFVMSSSKKPEEVGGVYSETQEEYESRKEAADSWENQIKDKQNPGKVRDQLYIEIANKKIWPTSKKYHEINSTEIVEVNLKFPWPNALNSLAFKLKEWDHFKDDNLGSFSISKSDFDSSPSKQIIKTVTSEEEGSIYKVYLELKANA